MINTIIAIKKNFIIRTIDFLIEKKRIIFLSNIKIIIY